MKNTVTVCLATLLVALLTVSGFAQDGYVAPSVAVQPPAVEIARVIGNDDTSRNNEPANTIIGMVPDGNDYDASDNNTPVVLATVPKETQRGLVTVTPEPPVHNGRDGRDGVDGNDGRDGRTIYVGGRQMRLDHRGRVLSVGGKRGVLTTRGHRALWKELHRAGVIGKGEIEKRDRETLSAAATYTDQRVGAVSTRTWIAIVLSIIALVVGAVAWLRRPHFHPVHY